MTDTTDYTIAAQTEQGAVIIAEVTHADLTERDTTGHGTIEHIDPNEIQVETNVRTIVKVDPALVASIREFGVLEPVVCRRGEDGTVRKQNVAEAEGWYTSIVSEMFAKPAAAPAAPAAPAKAAPAKKS